MHEASRDVLRHSLIIMGWCNDTGVQLYTTQNRVALPTLLDFGQFTDLIASDTELTLRHDEK